MDYEVKDCIDAGTEYCPCNLAETGDCILCSQLQGKKFCDCTNWKGVCIYQEYAWNNEKPVSQRKDSLCKIIKKQQLNENIFTLTILAKHKLVQELSVPGSFVFIRNTDKNSYYDAPISIMDSDLTENTLIVAIELKGIKTKSLNKLRENDSVLIRGPYWNGVLGLKNINNCKNGISLLLARGIGMAPMVPVMKKLYSNGNKIVVLLDKTDIKTIFINDYLTMCNATIIEIDSMKNGVLTDEFIKTLNIHLTKAHLVFCSGADIFIKNTLKLIPDTIKLACSNNAKMCCGEGICGTCSTRYKGHVVKKLCKMQLDPKYVFKDRRLI